MSSILANYLVPTTKHSERGQTNASPQTITYQNANARKGTSLISNLPHHHKVKLLNAPSHHPAHIHPGRTIQRIIMSAARTTRKKSLSFRIQSPTQCFFNIGARRCLSRFKRHRRISGFLISAAFSLLMISQSGASRN